MPDTLQQLYAEILPDILRRLRYLEQIDRPGGGGGDADTVDGFHASAVPTPSTILPLNAAGIFADDVVGLGTILDEAQVWAESWDNAVAFVTANSAAWQNDTQTRICTPRRVSTVVVVGMILWADTTATRAAQSVMRWNLNGVAGLETGTLGCQVSRNEGHVVVGLFPAVAPIDNILLLQVQKTTAADAQNVYARRVAIIYIPEDAVAPAASLDPWLTSVEPLPAVEPAASGDILDTWLTDVEPMPEAVGV